MGNTDKKEQGFTRVPNELYDAVLSQRLTATQERALLYIIRKTCGFQKREDKISISKMARETGFSRRAMINAVHDLTKMGIIKCGTVTSGTPTYMTINHPSYWDRDPFRTV